MAEKFENKILITSQEYHRAIDGILGDMNPENCTSTVEIYAMFSKIAQIITDSQRYDEMNVVDSAKIDDSIECIKTMLKSMIGDETFNYAVMSHLGMLDNDAASDDGDATSDDEDDDSDEDSDDGDEEASEHVNANESISSKMAMNRQNLDELSKGSPLANIVKTIHEDAIASDESKDEPTEDGSIEGDESSEDAAEKDNESIDYESIDMFKVWYTSRTFDFNDFDGYVLLAAIGRRHGFDSGYVTEQLLYIMHNYNIGCNKIHYIGTAITTNGVQKAFGKDPKAGDLVYFAYCEKPTFVMYSNMPHKQQYIIYQLDKETSAIIEIWDKPDLKSVCNVLNNIDVDKTAFSTGFDELKNLCRERDIDFNMLYRKVVECYTQGANLSIDHVSNIKFDVTKTFETKAECIYAKENGSDGDLFFIAPSNKSNKKSGWMIFALIAGYHQDKTRKLFQVDSIKMADYDKTIVSSKPASELDTEDDTDDGDDIDVSSMKYMTNEDISKNIKDGYDEMMRHLNDTQ